MTEQQSPDRRGTFWDWPTGWVLAGLVLALVGSINAAPGGVMIGLLLAAVGVVMWLARAGALSPRRRP